MKILGVGRATCYSPHSEARDGAILQAVQHRLEEEYGYEVVQINETQIDSLKKEIPTCKGIFSMARSAEALYLEAEAEKGGIAVCNSALSRMQLSRRALINLCRDNQLSIPTCYTQETDVPTRFPLWLKSDDGTTQTAEDVTLCHDSNELLVAKQRLKQRGIRHYIMEEHIVGDLIKFYGAEGTDFFCYLYPTRTGFSKFGTESANSPLQEFAFDVEQLRCQANSIAQHCGISLYGGDAVICADGSFYFIDFNDWPSYAPCLAKAARALAKRIDQAIRQTQI